MTRYVVLALASVGGLVLGGALGISLATLTEPATAVVSTQLTETNPEGTEHAAAAAPDGAAPDAKAAPDTEELRDTSTSDPGTNLGVASNDNPADVSAAAADYEELARRRDDNIALVSDAIVAVESYGCGVGVRATGLSIDAGTVLIPPVVNEASWYVAVDDDGFVMPQHLLVAGTFPAIRASAGNSLSEAAVPFGDFAPDEGATVLWAEDGSPAAWATGTVVASTASSFEIRVTSAVAASAIGGVVVNDEGALVGVIESIDHETVTGRPLTSLSPRDEVAPAPGCTRLPSETVTEPFGAFNALVRPEIKALLALQLEEDHLANGDYELAQRMDATLAKLSWDQMVSGWSVTDDSFVVPVHWSNTGGAVEWRLGLVTHESDGTSKLFCVTRSYDDPAQTVIRSSRGSSVVFERRPGWVEPNEVLDEIRAAC